MTASQERIAALRKRLGRTFPDVDRVFDECAAEAIRLLSEAGVDEWLAHAKLLGSLGRGAEPMLVYLEEAPIVAEILGEAALGRLKDMAYAISRTPNGKAIVPFLQTAAAAARRLETLEMFDAYLELVEQVMRETTTSVHGIVATHPSPCFVDFLKSVPSLLSKLSLAGMKNWIDFGIHGFANDPDGQSDYFALQAPVAHTVLQRERHGTLLVDHERLLSLYLTALWELDDVRLYPFTLLFDEIRKQQPFIDRQGFHLPDVYDPQGPVSGIDRYRAALAHMAAHRRWTTQVPGDNLSPFQHLAASWFEDLRVELLAIRRWPGLRRLWLALHPRPVEGAAPAGASDLYHRLAMFSRAALDPEHGYRDPVLNDFVARLHAAVDAGADTAEIVKLAIQWYVKSRKPTDAATTLFLDDTEVSYRDDNRHMWFYHEEEEDEPPVSSEEQPQESEFEMPPRHYDEWDYKAERYRPDWVAVYECLHPSGSAAEIDRLLDKHAATAKRLKRILDQLKPQDRVRLRFQEDGSELDLDVAIRSIVDFRAGSQPDPRINMSHRTAGRSIAVSLLLDLSVSLNETPEGCAQTILELSQEAVSLLAWTVDQMGDPLAIGGFHSNGRHEVRFYHFKGYGEGWGDPVKARLARMEGALSTRMGAAMRHAGRYLGMQQADKKLLLVLTDGRPHDVDVKDAQYLIRDAHKAVAELDRDGIYTYCINLDAQADEYVADIFGSHYMVIDHVERLPERLPELFLKLTK